MCVWFVALPSLLKEGLLHLRLSAPNWESENNKYTNTVGIWKPTIRKPESVENWTFWRSVFEWSLWSRFLNGPDHLKTGQNGRFSLDHFLYKKNMIEYEMVQASEPFENRTKSTIWKADMSSFRIPNVFAGNLQLFTSGTMSDIFALEGALCPLIC